MKKLVAPLVLLCALGLAAPARDTAQSKEIPGGTVVSVRTIDPVDSQNDTQGQVYRASLSEDLVVNGTVIARKNDPAQIRLHTLSQSGKMTGNTEVTLELYTVTINGKAVPVTSGDVTQDSSSGKGKKTARNAGFGALAGTVIGAIAGGGKGAAIGAVSGGALGAGASVLTKGPKVRIPSETLLRFTVAQNAKYE